MKGYIFFIFLIIFICPIYSQDYSEMIYEYDNQLFNLKEEYIKICDYLLENDFYFTFPIPRYFLNRMYENWLYKKTEAKKKWLKIARRERIEKDFVKSYSNRWNQYFSNLTINWKEILDIYKTKIRFQELSLKLKEETKEELSKKNILSKITLSKKEWEKFFDEYQSKYKSKDPRWEHLWDIHQSYWDIIEKYRIFDIQINKMVSKTSKKLEKYNYENPITLKRFQKEVKKIVNKIQSIQVSVDVCNAKKNYDTDSMYNNFIQQLIENRSIRVIIKNQSAKTYIVNTGFGYYPVNKNGYLTSSSKVTPVHNDYTLKNDNFLGYGFIDEENDKKYIFKPEKNKKYSDYSWIIPVIVKDMNE